MPNLPDQVLDVHPVETETTTAPQAESSSPTLVEQDLLIEDVSIDGMCGVY